MVGQLVVVLALGLLILAAREYSLWWNQCDRLREDREVADLEALFDLDWEWPR